MREDSVLQGSQYSFMDLCKKALGTEQLASPLDFVIFPSCSSEHDPEVIGFGASFQEVYGKVPIYNICNQGIVSLFTAIHVATKLIRNVPTHRQGLIVGIEQNTNAVSINYTGPLPTENNVSTLRAHQEKIPSAYAIIESGVYHPSRMISTIDTWIQQRKLDPKNIHLLVKVDDIQKYPLLELCQKFSFSTHTHPNSVNCLTRILSDKPLMACQEPIIIILLLDPYSGNYGYLIVNRDGSR